MSRAIERTSRSPWCPICHPPSPIAPRAARTWCATRNAEYPQLEHHVRQRFPGSMMPSSSAFRRRRSGRLLIVLRSEGYRIPFADIVSIASWIRVSSAVGATGAAAAVPASGAAASEVRTARRDIDLSAAMVGDPIWGRLGITQRPPLVRAAIVGTSGREASHGHGPTVGVEPLLQTLPIAPDAGGPRGRGRRRRWPLSSRAGSSRRARHARRRAERG